MTLLLLLTDLGETEGQRPGGADFVNLARFAECSLDDVTIIIVELKREKHNFFMNFSMLTDFRQGATLIYVLLFPFSVGSFISRMLKY